MKKLRVNGTDLVLLLGDIIHQDTDAIVNAANSGLLGGGGVDGAIHRAGGPEILNQCRKIREESGPCPTGNAVITSGGNLKAHFVIHAVGPVWKDGKSNEVDLLSSAYRQSLNLAVRNNVRTISFPSISTGIYGFPVDRASEIAFRTVREFVRENPSIREVRFITFSQGDYDHYVRFFSDT